MRLIPAAVTSVCLALLASSADGFVVSNVPSYASPSRSVRKVPVDANPKKVHLTGRLHADATAEAQDTTANSSDDEDDHNIGPISSRLDHEHSTAETYDPFTTTALSKYKALHEESIRSPAKFWSEQARELLSWSKPFNPHAVMGGGLDHGDVTWFNGGKLNVCYNAVDRHVETGRGDEVAMVWEVSLVLYVMLRMDSYMQLHDIASLFWCWEIFVIPHVVL